MLPIDEHFELWATRVEQLVGRPIDRKHARDAFECYEPPKKGLTPEEYAWELQSRTMWMLAVQNRAPEIWGDLNGMPPHSQSHDGRTNSLGEHRPYEHESGGAWVTRAPQIWKSDAPVQRILNWIWWLLRR